MELARKQTALHGISSVFCWEELVTSHFVLLKYLPGCCEGSEWVQEGRWWMVVQARAMLLGRALALELEESGWR